MLWKIVIVFLCAMVLVGMIGKLVFPDRGASRRKDKPKTVTLCGSCGRPLIGRGPCACGKDRP